MQQICDTQDEHRGICKTFVQLDKVHDTEEFLNISDCVAS